jgi:hypothetical protein
MRLTVEDGSGNPEANSYIDMADAERHLPSALAAGWLALSEEERADRLAAASGFVDSSFRWLGERGGPEQGMCWPRTGVGEVPGDSVPAEVRRASLAALEILMAEGPDAFRHRERQSVRRERFDMIETEYFEPGGGDEGKSPYARINNLLRGLFLAEGPVGFAVSKVERA